MDFRQILAKETHMTIRGKFLNIYILETTRMN